MITGTSFSRNENSRISMMPSQKVGIEMKSDGTDWIAPRNQAKGVRLDRKAMTTARTAANRKPSDASFSVAGR
ncbi:hypothetical protein D3C87_2056770 [compost metagenome]